MAAFVPVHGTLMNDRLRYSREAGITNSTFKRLRCLSAASPPEARADALHGHASTPDARPSVAAPRSTTLATSVSDRPARLERDTSPPAPRNTCAGTALRPAIALPRLTCTSRR